MNIRSIVMEKLESIGADGLCNDDCGCELNDLMPCDSFDISECIPAKKKLATKEDRNRLSLDRGDTLMKPFRVKK